MSIPPCKALSKGTFTSHFTIYLDDETADQVRAYAAQSQQKLAVALRDLIEFGLEAVDPAKCSQGDGLAHEVKRVNEH